MRCVFRTCLFTSLLAYLCLGTLLATAQDKGAGELAQKLQNPVADIISAPVQVNFDQNIGPDEDGERWLTNIQPVIPVSINENWNMISRTILPLISQRDIVDGYGRKSGNGDILQSLFFSPKKPTSSGWIWGAGPALTLPIASRDELGSEKWSAGPTAVALKQDGPWTMGLLVNHLISYAGDDDRNDVSATFIQPFLGHAWSSGTSLTLNSETTFDWEADDQQIPLNLVAAQMAPIGDQIFQFAFGLRYYLDSYDNGAEGLGARFIAVWLLPK